MRRIAAAALVLALVGCGASVRAQTEPPTAATAPAPRSAITGAQFAEAPGSTPEPAPSATPPEPGIWRLGLTPTVEVQNARDASGGYGPATPLPTLTPNPGFPGQSNLVPPG